MEASRKSYPSDVSDEEWNFVASYLTLMTEDAPQREHSLREVFNALRWLVKTGGQWRYLPHDFPPWYAVYQQTQRWVRANVFEAMTHDLRMILRLTDEREANPSATILDSRTLQSSPESGRRAGYDGAKKRKGSKVHVAVDTLGHLLALKVTAANEQDRQQVGALCARMQEVTGSTVEVAFVDQGYTGERAIRDAAEQNVQLEVVKHTEAKRGFVLLPRRWVIERTFGWMARFRRLSRDYERFAKTLASWHWLVAVSLMMRQVFSESS
jgi:transposase